MGLKYFKNQGEGKFELMLQGIIGLDVDGFAVAEEIKALNEIGAKQITQSINSIGGSVVQGYSIVSANLLSKAKIITQCTGVADSIAAVIFSTGDERKIMEFGSVMIHNVLLGQTKIEEIENENDKAEAIKMNDSIVNILSNKCGGGESRIRELMSNETRFNADEAITHGLADEKIMIGQGKNKPALMENSSREQWMNICKEFSANDGQNINKNKNKMKKVLAFLNLNADAAEESVLSTVKDLQNKAGQLPGLQTRVDKLAAENKSLKKAEAGNEVQGYIDQGLFDATKKEELVNMAIDNPEAFKALKMIKPEYVNISDGLKSGKKEEKKGEGEKTEKELVDEFVNMQQNDPDGLERLERENPEDFNKMLDAYNNAE